MLTNEALERAGKRERVSLRSLKAQGIDRPPEPKLGMSRTGMYRKGIVTETAQEMMQVRLIASHQKNRAQIRRELGRAKIAQYKEKQKERLVGVSATEVLKLVKKAKRDLYDKIERNEKSQYELGGFKSRGVQEIRFHKTNDSFTQQRRAELTTRLVQYQKDLQEIKKYEKELSLVKEMTLQVRQQGNWTKRESVVNMQQFQSTVEKAKDRHYEQSIAQERQLSRGEND